MNRQIRMLGGLLMALFALLFIQLNNLQVIRAAKLNNDPRNTRQAIKDFSRKRGTIVAADGTILAQSSPVDDQFKFQRTYPQGKLFSGVVGSFSFTFGSTGAEAAFGDDLASNRSLGDQLLGADREVVSNVTLTLRAGLQKVAMDQLGDKKGSVVALDPRTGAILAMYSNPSIDLSPLADHDQTKGRAFFDALKANKDKPDLNRAFRERFPPGSTFKVVTATAAVQQAPDLATKTYPVLRSLPLPQTKGQTLSNFGGSSCGGVLPDLLRVSCNTGFAQMGLDLGADRLSSQASAFGFNAKPPIDLPGVASAIFPGAEAFARDLPGLAKSAIGQQDVSATPLEMALIAGALGNGGRMMVPHVLADVRDESGTVVRTFSPKPWQPTGRDATTPDVASQIRDFMVGVVRNGTGTRAQISGVTVAGKSGTAQTTGDLANAWFIAFAPAEAPTVAVAVIVEGQPGVSGGDNQTGGRVAAPIARAILLAALGK